jgi:hypothetical protein
LVHDLLQLNLGRGFYRYDDFVTAPTVLSDASKGSYAGGGYVSQDGFYDFFTYGSAAARRPIDELEGDAVVRAQIQLGPRWHKCVVPFGIDNSSFKGALGKGRSRAARLNALCRESFALQIRYQ